MITRKYIYWNWHHKQSRNLHSDVGLLPRGKFTNANSSKLNREFQRIWQSIDNNAVIQKHVATTCICRNIPRHSQKSLWYIRRETLLRGNEDGHKSSDIWCVQIFNGVFIERSLGGRALFSIETEKIDHYPFWVEFDNFRRRINCQHERLNKSVG